MLTVLTEHSEDFFLTASQQDFVDNYKFMWELNREIDTKGFGIKVGGDIADYSPHAVEFLDMKSPGESVLSGDRKSTRLNSSHIQKSRMPSSA